MEIKALLFDLDGLLIDSERVYARFWCEASETLCYNLPYADILKLRSCDSSLAKEIIFAATGDEYAYDRIRLLRKKLMSEYMLTHTIPLKNGVVELLTELKRTTLKNIIVTSSNPDEKLKLLSSYGIDSYFSEIISVKDVKKGKPFPDIYLYTCEFLGLCPDECVALEDSPNGVISAYTAGIHVIMVPDLSKPDDNLKGKCVVANSLLDVIAIINKMLYK